MVFNGTKLALEVIYPKQGGGFQQAFVHSIESPTSGETNYEKVLKNSLAVEQKVPFESKDKMVEAIKDAIDSMDLAGKRENVKQLLPISSKQAIITINGVDQERTKMLMDKVAICNNEESSSSRPGYLIDYCLSSNHRKPL